jgi:hypothetical protein
VGAVAGWVDGHRLKFDDIDRSGRE